MLVISAWLAAAMLLLLADAAWALPEMWRWGLLVVMGMSLLAGGWWARPATEQPQQARLHDARRLELHHELPDHPLTTALQLSRARDVTPDALTAGLVARAEARACDGFAKAGGAIPGEGDALRRAVGYLVVVLAAWAVVAALEPALVTHGTARMVWPAGAQPAFGAMQIEVRAEPARPLRGEDVRIEARISGPEPTEARLVEIEDGTSAVLSRWPMASVEDRVFERTLHALREPVTVRVEVGSVRSAPVHIAPRRSATREDDHGDSREAERAHPPSPGDAAEAAVGPTNEERSELRAALDALARQAEALREQANELLAMKGEPDLDESAAQVSAFESAAAALRSSLGDEVDAVDAGRMVSLLETLDALRIAGLPDAAEVTAPRGWLESLERAAEADADTLQRLAGALMGEASAGEQVEGAAEADETTTPAATGDYHEWLQAVHEGGPELEAFMRRVPAGYRDLVGAYYRRLSVDERRLRDE